MLAAVLALAASASWGIADFLGGTKSRVVPLLAVMAVAQPVGLLSVAVIVAVRGEGPPGGAAIFWAVPAALLGTCGIAAFYRGMAIGAISIVAPIAGTGAAIPILVGLARGDDPSGLQLAGFALALGGVVAASIETDPVRRRSARVSAGVGWGLVAAVGFGAYFVPMHAAANEDFLWASLLFRATSATLILLAVLAIRPALGLTRGPRGAIALI